ncbi:MAG: murein L,D-transpeptidase catalytic domain family protein [Oligoflexia bacterium]|nr:murein L,D-transpeptidase catalytic domain family protein [Oligoflexia bacterium]
MKVLLFGFVCFFCSAISVAYAAKHSFSKSLRLKEANSSRQILVPAGQGYTFEILQLGEKEAVIKIYDRSGATLMGEYLVSNSIINDAIQKKIEEGLKASTEGAQAEDKDCCNVSDPQDVREEEKAKLVVTVQEKAPVVVKKPEVVVQDKKIPLPEWRPEYKPPEEKEEDPPPRAETYSGSRTGICGVYQKLLRAGVPREPLAQALMFYDQKKGSSLPSARYLAIADLSQRSSKKRFYLLDIKDGRLVSQEKVSHGGGLAKKGSPGDPNHDGMIDRCGESHKGPDGMTRAGFFKVLDFYMSSSGRYNGWPLVVKKPPRNGMRLMGLSPGVNTNALSQGVVMHEAKYNSAAVGTNMGRSHGCPAFAPGKGAPIMQKLRGGSLFYNYAPKCSSDMGKVYKQVAGWQNFCR